MLKKALFLLMAMLTVPNLASAYNYWSISATTSPATLSGSITRPANTAPAEGYNTPAGSSTTYVTKETNTTADFTVDTAPAGYVLSYVLIDGVRYLPPAPMPASIAYTVNKGSKISHTLSAVYAVQKYSVTTSKTGVGSIDPTASVPYGGSKTVNIAAGTGFVIGSVTKADGSEIDAAPGAANSAYAASYSFSNITEAKTIKANFLQIAQVEAKIATTSQSIAVGTPIYLDGTPSTSTVAGETYAWSLAGGAASQLVSPVASPWQYGGLGTDARADLAKFTPTATGSYTITLLVTSGTTTDSTSVVITVTSQAQAESSACLACHNDRNPELVQAWEAGSHGDSANSCMTCHLNGGHSSERHAESAGGNGGYTQLIAQNAAGRDIAAGSNACLECHFDVADWSNTPHTQKAQLGKEAVLGYNADPALYSRAALWIKNNQETYLHPGNKNADGSVKDASKLGVRAVMTEKPAVTYSDRTFGVEDIAVVIGSNYKQAYGVWMPGYGYKILNIRYNSIGLGAEAMGERTDERVWEGSCIGCHLTGYDPTDLQAEYKNTVVPYDLNPYIADMRVGCEACHGPVADGTLNPANLTQDQQIDICGRCHGNWNPTVPGTTARKDVPEFKPGDSLVHLLSPEYNNGVDRLMRPVWGSVDIKAFKKNGSASDDHEQWYDFKIGKHYGKKTADGHHVTCTSCHDPHDNIPGRNYGRRILKGDYDYSAGTSTICASCHPNASFVVNGKTVTKKGVSGALNPHTGKAYGVGVDVVPTDPNAKWPWEVQ
jgi:hypothetical protein